MSAPKGLAKPRPTHSDLFELLPWYVNGSLPMEERNAVAEHLEHCGCCADETNWLRQVFHGTNAATELYPPSSRSFEAVRARIGASTPQHNAHNATGRNVAAMLTRLRDGIVGLFGNRISWVAAPVAVALAVATCVDLLNPGGAPYSAGSMTTLTARPAADGGAELAIVPSTQAAEQVIQAALSQVGARGALQADANGELRLVLEPGADVDAVRGLLAALQSSSEIDSAKIAPD